MTETFILGSVGSPFGLKGFVKVRSFSGETGHLSSLKDVNLRRDGREKLFAVEETQPLNDSAIILIKFSGINSAEEAKTLTGAEIIAQRSFAAPLKQGEYYVEDLKGLRVMPADAPACSGEEEVLGYITDILEGGGGELAEIRLLSGKTTLVPFRDEFFGEISLDRNRVILLERWILEE